jgi:hypothetical protein
MISPQSLFWLFHSRPAVVSSLILSITACHLPSCASDETQAIVASTQAKPYDRVYWWQRDAGIVPNSVQAGNVLISAMDDLNVQQLWGISPYLDLLKLSPRLQEATGLQGLPGAVPAAAEPKQDSTHVLQVCSIQQPRLLL